MDLTNYHQKYANYTDEEIENRGLEKKEELVKIFKQTKFNCQEDVIRIAVLGCGDKRLIKIHQGMFQELLGKPVELTTFDITVDHLAGGNNVISHDCTLPLPNAPYDITYAHVLLKFIKTEKQWDVIKNSFDALKSGGLAIHVMDKDDYETKELLLPNGQFAVPLDRWKKNLDLIGAEYKEIDVKYGLALVIFKK